MVKAQLLGPNLLGQRGGNIGGSWDPHPFFHGCSGFGFEKFGLKIIQLLLQNHADKTKVGGGYMEDRMLVNPTVIDWGPTKEKYGGHVSTHP